MILLLAQVLSPVNRLCQFLQTRNLNFCSIDNKIDELFKQLKIIKENISLFDVVDAPLKYFSKCGSMLQFASERMEFRWRLRSANELLLDDDIIKDRIEKFVTHTGQKCIENLVQEIENAMKEKIEILNYFDAFNTQSKEDHVKNISELANYYGQPKQNIFQGFTWCYQMNFFQLLRNSSV